MSQVTASLKGSIIENKIKIFCPDKRTGRIKNAQKGRRNNGIKKWSLKDKREHDNDRRLSDVQKRRNTRVIVNKIKFNNRG